MSNADQVCSGVVVIVRRFTIWENHMRFVTNGLLILVVVLAIVVGGWGISLMARATAGQRTTISGQTVPLVSHAQLVGATSGQQPLQLSIGLQIRNQQALTGLLSSIYNPHSALYHHFLTPQQFATQFA